ncbi:MAG TPA: hypothetical protein VHC21_03840 [Candidatus Saccharimonadales bacterium]|nr:hypothetical protein [Candidatus Saccharimonadales bacterium]
MTATNHALTGALIGLVVGEPLIALPAALVSHFVCDAIPHFGSALPPQVNLRRNNFRNYLILEFCLCVLLVAVLAVLRPEHWFLAAVCAFLATSPDLLSIDRYLKVRRGQHWKRGAYGKFACGIQWFERPIGAVVEAAWFIAAIVLLVPFLR